MRVYLSGPMSGIPQLNVPMFDKAAAELRAQGYEVVSPAEEDRAAGIDTRQFSAGHTWGDLLAQDVKTIADGKIDAIVVLPKWYKSKGARLEVFLGLLRGIPIYGYRSAAAPNPIPNHTVLWFLQDSFQ